MLITRVASKEVQFIAKNSHSVSISRHRNHTRNLRLNPGHRVQVKDVNIVKAFVTVVASKHVEFASNATHRVACAGRWLLATDFRLGPDEAHRVEKM